MEKAGRKQEISIHALLAESDNCKMLTRMVQTYFYPRSPCGERRRGRSRPLPRAGISIHALLAESDARRCKRRTAARPISIHALLAESDHRTLRGRSEFPKFLSTLSLRRATRYALVPVGNELFLSTLSLRRATFRTNLHTVHPLFLSTLSLRRATVKRPCAACRD